MSAIVVDTSSWISYFRGDSNPEIDSALQESRIFLPPVVIAELLSGVRKKGEREGLIDFMSDLSLCDSDFAHWTRVGQLRSELSAKGLNMSTPDAHVAQCALDLDGILITKDAVFKKATQWIPLRVLT